MGGVSSPDCAFRALTASAILFTMVKFPEITDSMLAILSESNPVPSVFTK